jgi:hypothetical protein
MYYASVFSSVDSITDEKVIIQGKLKRMKKLSAFFKVVLIFLRKSALLPREKGSPFKKKFSS